MILLKFSGVAGFVGTFILTTASPAQTPFIASESCDWTGKLKPAPIKHKVLID